MMEVGVFVKRVKSVASWLAKNRLIPYAILFLMIASYFIVFTATVLNEYNQFWYGNFDLGIPD